MRQQILHQWKNIQLIEKEVTLPTGQSICHTTIIHPGAAVILPITENGEIILLKQFRPSLNKWILELPAGTIENNEDPLTCAKRELTEESGYRAQEIHPLGQCTPMAGFCDEIQYLFVATRLSAPAQQQLDNDEIIDVTQASLKQVEQWICDDVLTDAKTIACISKAKLCGYFDR
ncbi:NUDIX hydrolase [Vibrio sp. S11_S32]|uniref:NUDIX hydrolase n=1 Tax=Vibrio sp. S11_S32 TaxID=2720225 RepID=UPI0016806F87|nr:NUDIX hydrolase [Vibrio sp. S11_S32]MBD1576643.1 NUDIX hydrolase [Vibrio sp. S11_S32]